MRVLSSVLCGALVAALACQDDESKPDGPRPPTAVSVAHARPQPNELKKESQQTKPQPVNERNTTPVQKQAFNEFADQAKAALGVFKDIRVFERSSGHGQWELVNGKFVPVTVHGKTPQEYKPQMASDRPMMLPIHVEGYTEGDGQSVPYSVVGRMPGSNPEVQWVFVVRQYFIKALTDDDLPISPDIAVIGHHPRTGASVFFQYYNPKAPQSGEVVVSPFDKQKGPGFWPTVQTLVGFGCERCHSADAFIHTPWINQVHSESGETMVPSSPLGPYFYVAAQKGEPFNSWNYALSYLDDAQNKCTACHRVTPTDLIGLTQSSTRYAGLIGDRNAFAVASDKYHTDMFRNTHWMPAISLIDFYAGQDEVDDDWDSLYKHSAATVNNLERDEKRLKPTPRPPQGYETILVDRPEQDEVRPGESLWVVDTRLKANTKSRLAEWKFVGKQASDQLTVAPVVYRRKKNDGAIIEFEVVFVGKSRSFGEASKWLTLQEESGAFALQQGDYLGLVFTNTSATPEKAVVPFTNDDWAKLEWPDGSARLHQDYVTYRVASKELPKEGPTLAFKEAAYRTYSVEFWNETFDASARH